MSNKRRRQTKKKHEVPLTEDMLNELNKASFGHQGSGYGYHQGYAGYDNYGQDPDEFYDMEDVWSNDNKYYGQQKYKVRVLICWPTLEFSVTDFFFVFQRQSNTTERETTRTRESARDNREKSNPYQSQLYDSWRTEWGGYYDQYRSGPSGASSSAEAVNHSGGNRSAYMTKGGRRLSYEDDF